MTVRKDWIIFIAGAVGVFLLGMYLVSQRPSRLPEVPKSAPVAPSEVVASVSAEIIHVSVTTPGKKDSFTLPWKEGTTACDVLSQAKESGKIRSVTLSDKYLTQFKTLLVTEINGYANNWTFKINNISPEQGCSLTNVRPKDSIDWASD